MRRRFLGKIKEKNNVIYYTSTDNLIVVPYAYNFGTLMINNEMSNNIGVMTFLADVTTIGEYTFAYCDTLKSITIPNSVVLIENCAFLSCRSLTNIAIPDSVKTIGISAFNDCVSLESVTIPDSVTTIGGSSFRGCDSLTSVTIPDSVTEIGYYAFSYCSSLESVTIGDSVTEIGGYAFSDCNSLISVYCKATTPPTLDNTLVFVNNNIDRKIYVPYQSLEAYKTATNWSIYADDIVGYDFENDTVVGG